MKDPFFLEPIPWLSDLVTPLSQKLGLKSLPLHIHEVVTAALFYSVIFYPISPIVSKWVAPQHYAHLPRKKRLNWDAHVVSMVQSLLINGLALWVMFVDEERSQMDAEGRIWGYTGASAFIQALAAGYFVWDLIVTSLNLDVFGPGTLAHAVAALTVFSLGFRPFVNFYGCNFILWELSTPFLNVHWFLDKVNLTGSRLQLYNGFLLLFTFFSCRLVYGPYQSFRVFGDMYELTGRRPTSSGSGVMNFATPDTTLPFWLAFSYLTSNLTLTSLNFYWFFMMIRAVRKRFKPNTNSAKEKTASKEAVVADIAQHACTTASGTAAEKTVRSRRA